MSFLRLTNVCKAFEGNRALTGVDLEVEPGETVAVIGPSGLWQNHFAPMHRSARPD